ncbi:MAG: DNA alkylation repair protein [Bacteroidaceae bacterium]|nr:DNA alkylation repair protein [Bacteroidaceae bacterium]
MTQTENTLPIIQRLREMSDEKYAEFQRKLLPTVSPESIIGVRTPALRTMAKELIASGEATAFISDTAHSLFEENQLHAFILSATKDFDVCLREVKRFLPHIDNWATCDQLSPKCFKKDKPALLQAIREWMADEHEYTVRFGIGMLMQHFLDDDFSPAYPEMVAAIRREEYYIRMMQAWYFATALAKQYESALPYIEKERLEKWTHNKAIQKAIESYRISDEQKEYLRSLRRK